MKRGIRSLFCLLGLLLLWCPLCAAEDERAFVDARDDMGYYVYTDSISYTSDHEATADIAVVKPANDCMFVYSTHFDWAAGTYQIINARVFRYDTKALLSESYTSLDARPYGDSSPMKSIVDYIYSHPQG